MQVNFNGVISVGGFFTASTPSSLPLSRPAKIIAPYWADVDIGGTGNIYYRESKDPILLTRATGEIRAAFPLLNNVKITDLFIATWDSVGYFYNGTDKVRNI